MKDQAATALQPLREIASLKPFTDDFSQRSKEIYDSIARRAFEIFESSGRVSGRDHEDWLKAEAELLHPVHLDIAESDEAITVRAEVPGFSARALEMVLAPRMSAERTLERFCPSTLGCISNRIDPHLKLAHADWELFYFLRIEGLPVGSLTSAKNDSYSRGPGL